MNEIIFTRKQLQLRVYNFGSVSLLCSFWLIMKRRIASVCRDMPFDGNENGDMDAKYPRDWKSKQRAWMLAGLRKLKAPTAT